MPAMQNALADFTTKTELFTLIDRQRAVKVWPIPVARDDGNWITAHVSATRAVEEAMHHWVQIDRVGGERGYVARRAIAHYSDPEWFQVEFRLILRLAWEGCTISTPDHPVAKALLGRA
jgi:hypothetical protein